MIDIHMLAGAPPASDLLWHDVLVAAAPHIIWACVLTGFAIWLGPKIVPSFMRRIRKIGYRGLEIELTGEIRESAIERAQPVSARQTSRIVHRLTASARLLESAHILWVDDEPENNRREVEILEELGAKIVLARTTAEARSFVENSRFDVLISDMRRDGNAREGLELLGILAARPSQPSIIFYVGSVQGPVPEGAFGITDRMDELFHLVLDALARRRS